MKRILWTWVAIAACLVGPDGAAAAGVSEHQKTVSGITINIGVVPVARATEFTAAAGAAKYPSGAQHLVVSLTDAKTGSRLGDARVVVEIKDPHGKIEKKSLNPAVTAGVSDYGEAFRFDWSGKYVIRVSVTPKGGQRPVTTSFEWTHAI
jgi:hypothetical protein